MTHRVILSLTLLAIPQVGSGQHIVEIDYSAGRTILGSEWRAIRLSDLATDWDRNLLYVHDPEEPDGIMVFSLETGEWLRTISTPRGEGPFEFPQGKGRMALATDGRLHVTATNRVITYDPNGIPIGHWTPTAPLVMAVCDLGGKPAIPIATGVLRHEDEIIGRGAVATESLGEFHVRSKEDGEAQMQATILQMYRTGLMCDEDRAFVVIPNDGLPDSVFVYSLNGDKRRHIPLPNELTDMGKCMRGGKPCPPWSHGTIPSTDQHGNLVLTTGMEWFVAAAIINPNTGCYTLVRKDPEFSDRDKVTVRVRADSALVLELPSEIRADGVRNINMYGNRASMYPLRHVSGPPCPGMLDVIKAAPLWR